MADDLEELENARAWVESLKDRWRLQILSKRTRTLADGMQKEIPTRIRRFVEGIPWAHVKPAIDELLAEAPYHGVIVNGTDFGVEYRPTLTTWQRDQQMNAASGQNRGDATYTLVQDLIENSERDTYVSGMSSSCSEEVTAEYVWDSPDVEELPQGEQGVTYSIQSVNRQEDGTFNYALVKRVAITQHEGPITTKADATSTVTTELWNNVYGSSSDGYRDNYGNPIEIPDSFESGRLCEVSVSENEDCTFRIQMQTTVTKDVQAKENSTATIYQRQEGETLYGQSKRLDPANPAKDGRIERRESTLGPDGTYQNESSDIQELGVRNAEVSASVTRKGKRVTVVDRNQPAPVSTNGLSVGASASYKKTDGGLYDNTKTTFDKSTKVTAGVECAKTIFDHTHGVTYGGGDLVKTDVSNAGGGKTYQRQSSLDDEGAVTTQETTKTELSVPKSVESWRVTQGGVLHTVKNSNASKPLSAPTWSSGKVGSSYENERTPGGLYNTTTSEIVRSKGQKVGASCSKTAFLHEDSSSETGKTLGTTHVKDASGGHYSETSSHLNDDGTVTNTTKETSEIPQNAASVSVHRAPKGVTTTTLARNGSNSSTVLPGFGAVKVTMTNGKAYDREVTEFTPSTGKGRESVEEDIFQKTESTDTYTSGNIGEVSPPSVGGGKYGAHSQTMDDVGCITDTSQVVSEKEVTKSDERIQRTAKMTVTTTTNTNVASPLGTPGVGGTVENKRTRGGRYITTMTVTEPNSGSDYYHNSKTLYRHEEVKSSFSSAHTVSETQVSAAFGGTIKEVTRQLDEHGIQTTQDKTTQEQDVVAAERSCMENAFEYRESNAEKGSSSNQGAIGMKASSLGAYGATIYSAKTERTPGNLFDVTIERRTAKGPYTWKATVTSDRTVVMHVGFKNYQSSDLQSLLDSDLNIDAVNSSKAKNTNYTNSSVACSASMNEFGLLDGQVTVSLLWEKTVSESSQSSTEPTALLKSWSYKIYAASFTPVFSDDEQTSLDHINATVVRSDYTDSIYQSGYPAENGSYYDGTSFSVTTGGGYRSKVCTNKHVTWLRLENKSDVPMK